MSRWCMVLPFCIIVKQPILLLVFVRWPLPKSEPGRWARSILVVGRQAASCFLLYPNHGDLWAVSETHLTIASGGCLCPFVHTRVLQAVGMELLSFRSFQLVQFRSHGVIKSIKLLGFSWQLHCVKIWGPSSCVVWRATWGAASYGETEHWHACSWSGIPPMSIERSSFLRWIWISKWVALKSSRFWQMLDFMIFEVSHLKSGVGL